MISGRGYQALGPLRDSSLSRRGYPPHLDEGHYLPTVRAPPIGRGPVSDPIPADCISMAVLADHLPSYSPAYTTLG